MDLIGGCFILENSVNSEKSKMEVDLLIQVLLALVLIFKKQQLVQNVLFGQYIWRHNNISK